MYYPANFDPRDLNGMSEWELDDYQDHIEAGLIDSGINKDGEIDWIGESQEWDKYEELKNK